jgi:putative phosphoesterase
MSRIALVADIHGNLVALEAVLHDIKHSTVDMVICLGDVAATGPQPHDTLERIRLLNCPVVMGNADEWLLHPPPPSANDLDEDTSKIETIDRWCLEQLTALDRMFLSSFVPTYALTVSTHVKLLCYHGSPRSSTDVIRAITPEAELVEQLGNARAEIMVGGHTHEQMIRRYQDMLLVNVGSVGLPYTFDPSTGQHYNPSWAEYGVLQIEKDHLSVMLKRVPVDVKAVRHAIDVSGVPHSAWLLNDWRSM